MALTNLYIAAINFKLEKLIEVSKFDTINTFQK